MMTEFRELWNMYFFIYAYQNRGSLWFLHLLNFLVYLSAIDILYILKYANSSKIGKVLTQMKLIFFCLFLCYRPPYPALSFSSNPQSFLFSEESLLVDDKHSNIWRKIQRKNLLEVGNRHLFGSHESVRYIGPNTVSFHFYFFSSHGVNIHIFIM